MLEPITDAVNPDIISPLAWTSPVARGKCFFCGRDEGGYAKKDANGDWQASCWPCIDPKRVV